ncbi:MAG: hypothetical protein COZ06_25000 [Armatimonadetes bacterium CG_4_10_14_3_um_filter_66_18]|nr:hypothetical protein [Armatimonadota bacterium]OIP07582.1 MAG: hypothetical protein AUJ96_07165 [Armatimonadetes bacterium CG2_30_66_41]PIU93872.1 MAG: hypothetical protein COS65_10405 [Armatimonadetes bacterium CG06_land_8_20_14_3_00_66_21]PIX49886.1 MAG: hypothetical protein COZ57_01770 [Armatimonadetes bacterium CG_4_8_14_3_um_filter_66_20]PIY42599.1 MAG: hypothetical protein COZ06_25000 [Armatimonadetes bacterium CG_4_10_14_3_um_filter_66_18]PIZ46799.1 MAG: hypothetical protein COY42_09
MASKYVMCATVCTLVLAPAWPEDASGARLQQLWTKLDALWKERDDLAWRRWQALSDLEKARIIVKHQRQGGPTKEELAALTEEKAPSILAEFTKKGTDGERQLRGFASYTIRSEESRAYQGRRRAIDEEIVALGEEAVPGLIDEMVREGTHRFVAREALSRISPVAVPALLEACEKQQDKPWCAELMEALAATKDSRAREALLRGLEHRWARVRSAALSGLLGIGTATQEMCLRFLAEEDRDSRSVAIRGLGEIGDVDAVPALMEVARTDPARGKGDFLPLRKAAYDALKKIAERTGAKIELPPEEVLRR